MKERVKLTRVSYYNGKSYSPSRIKTISETIPYGFTPKIYKTTPLFGHSTWTLRVNGDDSQKNDKRRFKLVFYGVLTIILIASVAFGIALWLSYLPPMKTPRKINIMYFNSNMKQSATVLIENNTLNEIPTTTIASVCAICSNVEVCLQNPGELVPTCRRIKDNQDPTGCGGLCSINRQYCRLLDAKHNIRACLNLQKPLGKGNCAPNQYACRNNAGVCLPKHTRCDGLIHCPDKSDEMNCVCNLKENFRCGQNLSCVSSKKKCDGSVDCWDASDEKNCTDGCGPDDFPCYDGGCLPKERFCDGVFDCVDKSDEPQGCSLDCIHSKCNTTN